MPTGLAWRPGDDISPHQTRLATSRRIPFLTTLSVDWYYITGFIVNPKSPTTFNSGMVPTEDEVRQLADHLDAYRDRWYRESFKRDMRELAPYDIDGSANFGFFRKTPSGWQYRKRTWESGPFWAPEEESTLLECIESAVGVRL